MCGLVGWIDFNKNLKAHVETLVAMEETMRRRGPDDGGVWVSTHAGVGHRRLSLVDLEGGVQPMISETPNGSVVLVYTGEIYNFVELRSELKAAGYSFRSRSDTEVVLLSYLHWGDRCVEHFNGMFAFAIWDERRQTLLLARDRLGIKPLYYYLYEGGILFASEPKGILANSLYTPAIRLGALPILLQPRLATAGHTPLTGIMEVEPARTITFNREGLTAKRYWKLESAPHPDDYDTTVARVRDLMHDIVARQIVADVPCAAMLSGGIDSTAVAALAIRKMAAAGNTAKLKTFCVSFDSDHTSFIATDLRPEVDSPYALEVATWLGTDHHDINIGAEQIERVLLDCCQSRDLPGFGQFDASMFLLCQHIAKHGKIALSGEAADEIFGGYPLFHDEALLAHNNFPWLRNGPRLTDYLVPELKDLIRPTELELDTYAQLLADVPRLPGENRKEARIREALYLNMQGPLAVILDRKDRISMANSLEVRVPFCDHRLVEYMWNVPWSMKCQTGVKGILKDAMKPYVPDVVRHRRKSAYPGMHNHAFEETFYNQAVAAVEHQQSPFYGMFDAAKIRELVSRMQQDKTWVNASHLLIPLVEASRWLRTYQVNFS